MLKTSCSVPKKYKKRKMSNNLCFLPCIIYFSSNKVFEDMITVIFENFYLNSCHVVFYRANLPLFSITLSLIHRNQVLGHYNP